MDKGEDLNYVLSGYFFKIFNHIFNSKRENLITYCFKNNSKILKQLISNIERKSVCDCIHKLLTEQSAEKFIDNPKDIKIKIIEEIFEKLETFSFEALMNVTDLFIDSLSNKNFYILLISEKKIFEKILEILKKDTPNKNEIIKCFLRILNNLNENILKDFGANIVTPFKVKEDEASMFSFNSINMALDDEFNEDLDVKKVSPEEIKIKLDENFVVFSEISIEIIRDFVQSDSEINNNLMMNTTYDQEKRRLGAKRYLKQLFYHNFF